MIRAISHTGLRLLQDRWLTDWHENPDRFKGGNAERWFNVVLDFLSARGDEVVPRALREQEERVITMGRSQEYLAALAETVHASPQHNEYDQTVLVLTASVEEREQALEKILGGKSNEIG